VPGLVARRVQVTGRVQGVWFREALRRACERRGVAGWARNRPDGSVEAVLEGPAEDVDAIVDWCRLGPPDARVDDVAVTEIDPRSLSGFAVRH
jgi:acylphosphatase